MTTMHLSDEQFTDLLAGDSAPKAAADHLEQCEHCQTELLEMRAAMQSFKEMSMAWAEAEAPRRIQPPSRWKMYRQTVPAWGLTLATALAISAIGIRREVMVRPADQAVAAVTSHAQAPASSDMAEDNRLMMSIDQELNYQVQPSVPVSELRAGESNSTAGQVAN